MTWTGSVDAMNPMARQGFTLPLDQCYAWPAFPRVPVDEGVTRVNVMQQTARSLATATSMIRAIDATTNKPETSSTLAIVPASLKQVATVQRGVPNVYLEQPAFNTVIENDLTLALNEALDKLVLDAIAGSGFQAPGTDQLLVSIRKAITTLQGNGFARTGCCSRPRTPRRWTSSSPASSGGSNDYGFGAGNFSTDSVFGLRDRGQGIAAATVVDSTALGKLYASRVSLARFEENAGKRNTSLVRLDTHAIFGVERSGAAVRIAAS